MTDTALHIQYLLRYHDCVILPGLGAFVKSYRKASVASDGTILPPATELSFNSSITSNDGLLAHSFMRRSGLSFEESRAKVAEKIEDLKTMLHADRELAFGKIGLLTLGEDNNICFSPFTPGYASVFTPIRKENPSASSEETATEAQDGGKRRRFNTARNYYIAINKRFAKVAAAFILVASAASTFVVPSLQDQTIPAVQRASVIPLAQPKENTATAEHETAPATQPTETASPDIQDIGTDDGKYYLIVGSFRTVGECDKFISSQPEEMAGNLKIAEGKKMCRVYAANSDSRDELLSVMRDEEFRSRYSQAWIWER